MTVRNPIRGGRRVLPRVRLALLALVAVAAVTAPTAAANTYPPIRSSLELVDLGIFDLYTTTACGKEVLATISGVHERKLVFDSDGVADRQIETFDGRITWFTRDGGKSYSSALVNRTRVDFPEGVDLFQPAKITVTSFAGSTFPVGDLRPGRGTLVYDAFIYAVDDEGFVYTATEGDPISTSANFLDLTPRICAALA